MNEILKYILAYCSYLYNDYGFIFTDSEVASSFGGDALLIMESDTLKMRFISDRSQLFLDVSAVSKNSEWYSIDLIRQMITGETDYFSLLDENNAKFLRNNIDKIIECFDKNNINNTTKELKKLKLIRNKKLFK